MKAPFPYFGGKRRVASVVWDRFGDVPNYVEPFCGSLAVLLGRPHEPRVETVNDLDCYLANFWRALQAAPDEVARHADWPVNEADLHARHLWLVNADDFRERMKTEPEHFDAKVAGWWVWGISQWIGSGWCAAALDERDPTRKRPQLSGKFVGVQAKYPGGKRPSLARGGKGVHGTALDESMSGAAAPAEPSRAEPSRAESSRVESSRAEPSRQLPDLRSSRGVQAARSRNCAAHAEQSVRQSANPVPLECWPGSQSARGSRR